MGRFQAKDGRVFHPTELAMRLKDECKSLKQEFGKLKEHISKYISIMFQITNMDKFEMLHDFLFGLQP